MTALRESEPASSRGFYDADGPIKMVIAEPSYRMVPLEDHYTLNAHGRMAWLQRLLWRALGRMGALKGAMAERLTHKTYTIDADRVIQRVMEARARLAKTGHPQRILIGPRELAELMADASLNDFALSPSPYAFTGRQFRGMTVEVVPHMRGVLVL